MVLCPKAGLWTFTRPGDEMSEGVFVAFLLTEQLVQGRYSVA